MEIKTGIVKTLYPERCTARVMFEDSDNLISAELQVVVKGSLKNKDYWMPDLESEVLCVFTNQKKGFILGSFYSEKVPPPVDKEHKRVVRFEDKTTYEYDSKTHTMTRYSPHTITEERSDVDLWEGVSWLK